MSIVTRVGGPITVNQEPGAGLLDIAALSDGGFAVAFTGSNAEFLGRNFLESGVAVSDEYPIALPFDDLVGAAALIVRDTGLTALVTDFDGGGAYEVGVTGITPTPAGELVDRADAQTD